MGSIGNALTFGVFSKSDQREKVDNNIILKIIIIYLLFKILD